LPARAAAGLAASPLDAVERPHLLYCVTLGHFKLGELIEARRCATQLAANTKDARAQALKEAIEDAIERDGAVGIVSPPSPLTHRSDRPPLPLSSKTRHLPAQLSLFLGGGEQAIVAGGFAAAAALVGFGLARLRR